MINKYTLAVLAAALAQGVSAKDITIFDGVTGTQFSGTQDIRSSMEDNETEPITVQAQSWDLEAFHLNGTTLSMIGGFNFLGGNDHQASGDIFIDVNGDAKYGTPLGGAQNGIQDVSNSLFKYDYVIHFTDRGDQSIGAGYEVRQIDAGTVVERSVYYGQNNESNPWIWKSGGTFVSSGTATQAAYAGTEYLGYNGDNTHYELKVDIGFLTATDGPGLDGTLFKFTMECGNDNLIGYVPDGGTTLALLGMGIGGLAFVSRRNRK